MISFRLTADEYERLSKLCFDCGSSVSELGRAAINSLLQHSPEAPRETLEYRVSELQDRLNILNFELKRLRQHDQAQSLGN